MRLTTCIGDGVEISVHQNSHTDYHYGKEITLIVLGKKGEFINSRESQN